MDCGWTLFLTSICLCLNGFLQQLVVGQDSLQRNYADQLQRIAPREPGEAIATLEHNPGLKIELIASEPLVMDPVAVSFDEWGRAFVVEMRGYSERESERLGRIKLLEDTDQDGVFDNSTIFAERFRWPTAIVCGFGGVLVGDAPDIIFLKDVDGDKKADLRQIVATGFGTSNVQQLPNSFQWGLDNKLYGASGGNGGQLRCVATPGVIGTGKTAFRPGEAVDIRGQDFTIDPATFEISAIAGGTQFGMTFDRWGTRFVCSNSNHCQQIVFEEKYAARNSQQKVPRSRVSVAADGPAAEVFRISPVEPWRKVRTRLRVQGLVRGPVEGGGRAAGYFTSATGICCYDGDWLPEAFAGDLFIGDVGSNLVHRKKLSGSKIQRVANRTNMNSEFLRSADNWFRPVQIANGPDGSLIVIDMYRETIEHPASLPPIIKQHLDLNSGNRRGRIYRVRPNDGGIRNRRLPGNASLPQLIEMISHTNGWHRRTASRLLLERKYSTQENQYVVDRLRTRGLSSVRPETRIRSMYLLAAWNKVQSEDLIALLADPVPHVRIHALRQSERQLDSELTEKIIAMTDDEDLRVRFQVALSLGELATETGTAIARLAASDGLNSWMQTALSSSAGGVRAETIKCLVHQIDSNPQLLAKCRPLLLELAGQLAREATDQDLSDVAGVLRDLPTKHQRLIGEIISRLLQLPPESLQLLRSNLKSSGVSLEKIIENTKARSRRDAVDDELPIPERIVAVKLLSMDQPEPVSLILPRLLQLNQPPEIKQAAIELAVRFKDDEIGEALLMALPELSPALRSTALNAVLARTSWSERLLGHLEAGKISSVLVDATSRQRLMQHPDSAIAKRAGKQLGGRQNPDREKLVNRYIDQVAQVEGNLDRGQALFRKSCIACHRLEDQGKDIGPNLAAFANRGAAAMITNILDPNREVDPRFLSYRIQLLDGRMMLGVLANETATTVSLQDSSGKTETILRNEIEVMRSTTLSLMPENFGDELDTQQMADLIAYILSQSQ